MGGLIGIANDLVTSAISPDYFVIGKGIPSDDLFRLRVVSLGFQAGLVMGLLVGGIYLIANNPKLNRRSLPLVQLFRFALPPILAAIALAPLGALLICRWDPLNFRSPSQLGDLLTPNQATHFLAVWGMHLGIYTGGLLGTVCGVFAIRQARNGIWSRFLARQD